jgi:Ca-activated chloride channel family protein
MTLRSPVLHLLAAVCATVASADLPGTLEIAITSPRAGEPVFGQVEVLVAVSSLEPIAKVELFVDGRYEGVRTSSPYRCLVDVGQANEAHRFEAVAEDVSGLRAQAVLQTPPISIDEEVAVELQQVFVTATRDGGPVEDLERHEFALTDDGSPEPLVTFERGSVPLTVLLAIDASRSMAGERLEMALQSARSFFGEMRPLDQARIVLFADHLLRASPFTGFPEVLGAGLGAVRARGGTALNDHVFMALKLLDAQQGRRVLILLSDGLDTTSMLSMEDVFWSAQRSQAMLYWLRLKPPGRHRDYTSAWRDSDGYRSELATLERMVRQSGGDVLELADTHEAQAALSGILRELRSQYVLGYYPSDRGYDGSWRSIHVRLSRRGVKLRYLGGYLDR